MEPHLAGMSAPGLAEFAARDRSDRLTPGPSGLSGSAQILANVITKRGDANVQISAANRDVIKRFYSAHTWKMIAREQLRFVLRQGKAAISLAALQTFAALASLTASGPWPKDVLSGT